TFLKDIAQQATEGQTPRFPPGIMHPLAADDVAAAVTDVALADPVNGTVTIAGPEPIRMDEFVRRFLNATKDSRKVVTDAHAKYFGAELNDQSLVPGPGDNPRRRYTRYDEELNR